MASARLPALLATALLVGVVVVQVLISVGVPIWKAIYFAQLSTSGSVPIDVGIWALCTKGGHCTSSTVGLKWDSAALQTTPKPDGNVLITGLTAALILHPIAGGIAALIAILSLWTSIRGRSTGLWWSVLGTLVVTFVTLASLGITLAVVLLARERYTGTVHFGPALWMSVGACAGVVLATILAIVAAGVATAHEATEFAPEEGYSVTKDPQGWSAEEEQELNFLRPAPPEAATSRTQLTQAHDYTPEESYPTYYTGTGPGIETETDPNWDSGYAQAHPYWGQPYAEGSQAYAAQPLPASGTIASQDKGYPTEGFSATDPYGVQSHSTHPHTDPSQSQTYPPQDQYPQDTYGMAYAYPLQEPPTHDDHNRVQYTHEAYDARYAPAAAQDPAPATPSESERGAITFGDPSGPAGAESSRTRTRDAYARVADTVSTSRGQRDAYQDARDWGSAAPEYSSWTSNQDQSLGYSTLARPPKN